MLTDTAKDSIAVSGWLFGLISLWVAIAQYYKAEGAKQAEQRVRRLLHTRRAIQQLLGLSDATMNLQKRVAGATRAAVRQDAVIVAADLTRVIAFVGTSLPTLESERLVNAKQSLSSALSVIALRGNSAIQVQEQQSIEQHCLDAALQIQAIRGHLEQMETLVEDQRGNRNDPTTKT